VEQSPERITREADRDENQEHLAERLMSDRLQRSALVGGLAARAERELDCQDSDNAVDHGARDETRPGE
jgi:hypothetical protein